MTAALVNQQAASIVQHCCSPLGCCVFKVHLVSVLGQHLTVCHRAALRQVTVGMGTPGAYGCLWLDM